jgi:thymidine kinase
MGYEVILEANPLLVSTYLMTLSDDIQELKTVCTYGDRTTMNMRI